MLEPMISMQGPWVRSNEHKKLVFLLKNKEVSIMTPFCNHSPWEVETGSSGVQDQPWLYSKFSLSLAWVIGDPVS